MAEEIKIPLRLMLNTQTNANGSWAPVSGGDTGVTMWGWLCREADATDYTFRTVYPIPDTVDSPANGEIWVRWVTDSTDTSSNFRYNFSVTDMGRAGSTENWSPTAFADTGSETQVSAGQRDDNIVKYALTNTAQTDDKMIIGVIGRDGQHASDTVVDDSWILEAWYVADIA